MALRRGHPSVTPDMVHKNGGRVLFGEPRMIELWTLRLERDLAHVETWVCSEDAKDHQLAFESWHDARSWLLPLVVKRDKRLLVFDDTIEFRKGDVLYLAVFEEQRASGVTHLTERGWQPEHTTSSIASTALMD